jgi:hypothetical protein
MQGLGSKLAALLLACATGAALADAQSVGQIKVSKGQVQIQRSQLLLPGPVGTAIYAADKVVTGADGAVGITFEDNSVLSTGPDSVLEISKFVFDTTTYEGEFEAKLDKGTMSASSGKIVKQTPEAMRIVTPSAILGVRGTEFYVKVDDPTLASAHASR